MKKREIILLVITVAIALGSLSYVYVLEPYLKSSVVSDSVALRYQQYLDLLNNQKQINEQAEQIFGSDYWKSDPEEQQIALQIYIEEIARSSGIRQVRSIYPLTINDKKESRSVDISLQIDLECSIRALTKLLYKIGTSNVPLQIKKLQIFSETGNPNLVRSNIEVASLWMPGLSKNK